MVNVQNYKDYYEDYQNRNKENKEQNIYIRNKDNSLNGNREKSIEQAFDKMALNDPNNLIKNKPSYHNMESKENSNNADSKLQQQKLYREYLQMQVSKKFLISNV